LFGSHIDWICRPYCLARISTPCPAAVTTMATWA
jgi:hypothetical protein